MNGTATRRAGDAGPSGHSYERGDPKNEERWTVVHSLGMVVAIAAAWVANDARPVALVGVPSILVFVALESGHWTETGAFGPANAITLTRLAIAAAVGLLPGAGPVAAALVIVALVLDGVDGSVARCRGQASSFGAKLDMETDSLLVAVATAKLAVTGRLGAWILVPGVLRYVYALAIRFAPTSLEEAPRTRFGRYVFAVLATSLAASLWPLEPIQRPLAACAAAITAHSFARSALWSFGKRRV